jgi:hypothetical protein
MTAADLALLSPAARDAFFDDLCERNAARARARRAAEREAFAQLLDARGATIAARGYRAEVEA